MPLFLAVGFCGVSSQTRILGLSWWSFIILFYLPFYWKSFLKIIPYVLPLAISMLIGSILSNSNYIYDYLIKDIPRIFLVYSPLIALIDKSKQLLATNEKNMRFGLRVIVSIWIIILLIGILQSVKGPLSILSWGIHYVLDYKDTAEFSFYGKGAPSLFPYAVPYSYFLTGQIILVFNYLKSKTLRMKIGSKTFYYFWVTLVVFATLISDRRSAQLALFVSFIFISYKYFLNIFLNKKINKILLTSILTFAIIISIFFSGQVTKVRERDLFDTSIKYHFYLFPASILDIVSDPFNNYPIFRNFEFMGFHSDTDLEGLSLHNGLATLKRRYTIFSLVGFIITLRFLYKPINSYKYTLFFIYALNMLFHNNIIFIQDPFGLIALSFALL